MSSAPDHEPQFRPSITVIRVTPDLSGVEVVLERDGQQAAGFSVLGDGEAVEAAARATVAAVQGLLRDDADVTFQWAAMYTPLADVPPLVNVGVVLTTAADNQPQKLLGAAYIHDEPAIGAVRAALDGLTRRLGRFGLDLED